MLRCCAEGLEAGAQAQAGVPAADVASYQAQIDELSALVKFYEKKMATLAEQHIIPAQEGIAGGTSACCLHASVFAVLGAYVLLLMTERLEGWEGALWQDCSPCINMALASALALRTVRGQLYNRSWIMVHVKM